MAESDRLSRQVAGGGELTPATSPNDYDRFFSEQLNRVLRRFMPRAASYRYFEHRQHMYCWTTEPVDGKFASFVYVPYGPGARTGKAERWRATRKVEHRLRRQAKARALRLYTEAKRDAS